MAHVQIFLSTVSAEFRSYREALRHYLDRPNVTVKVQEDFIVTGTETLDMLDQYIRACDVVVHLVGDMTGAAAQAPSVAVIRERYPDFADRLPVGDCLQAGGPALSYTQWEAWLALYHRRKLIIAAPQPGAKRDPAYVLDPAQQAAQQAHLASLASVERYPGFRFASPEHFAAEIWRSGLLDVLVEAGLIKKPIHLRYASLGELFKGREALLEKLAQRLGPVPQRSGAPLAPKVLTGLGGVGKTRLVVEYALRHADAYSALLLLSGDSPESLHRNLAALCGAAMLDLPEQSETDETRQRDAALAWLQCHPGWLLILDNVDNLTVAAAARALLSHLSGGHLLLTSRLTNWPAAMETLEVDVLAPDAAADFLLVRTEGNRRRSADDAEAAHELAQQLGYLALALEQAGAYIACRTASFRQYLAEWQSRRAQVLAWYDPSAMDYPASVAITWQASFDQLSEPARALLQRLAWLAPEPIPESLLDVSAGEADPAAAFDALAELKAFSLLTRSTEAPFFSVHRLVQEVTRRGQGEETNRLVEALNWVDAAFVGDPDDVRTWPVLDPLMRHARAIASCADEVGIPDPTARLLNQIGLLLLKKALYAEAEPLMRRTLCIDEARFGTDHPYVAIRLNNLAALLQDTHRLAEAEPLVRRALAIEVQSLGADHPNVARALNNLAAVLRATSRLAEAEPLMRRALAIDEASFGANHPYVAIRLNNLAQLLQATNRLAEAEPLMRRALAIDEASFGADHPNVARDLNNLATLLKATNRLNEAEPLMRRALAIDEASFGTHHPNVARDLNNLTQLLQATNRLNEAEPLMRRALAIDEASFGADHPNVAIRLNNLALLLKATNRLIEAEPLMRRVVSIFEASLGSDHPNVATALNNLAGLLQDTNRLAEAEPLMRRALAIDEASFGADHPNVARHLNNLATLLQATNRLNEAEPLMRRALAIDEASFGAHHPNVARDLNNLAQLLQDTNQLIEAEPLLRRALAIDEASFGAHHPNVARDLNNLAQLLQAINRLIEAEPLMRRALAIDGASFGVDHPSVAIDLNNLGQLLQATNRLTEAEPMMRRALEILTQFAEATGHDHPHRQTLQSNYGHLLRAMGRTETEIQAELAGLLAAITPGPRTPPASTGR